MKDKIIKALEELRKTKKRNFNQSVDLIINLKEFNPKTNSLNSIVELAHKTKNKKICALLNKKSKVVDSISKTEFSKYKDKKQVKKLSKKYDFFISSTNLMPSVATNFGRILGPLGKMPSPQIGILTSENDEEIKKIVNRLDKIIKIRTKEASIKLLIGKENMEDEKIAENFMAVFNKIKDSLPKKKENIKSVMIKFTMSKPIKIDFK